LAVFLLGGAATFAAGEYWQKQEFSRSLQEAQSVDLAMHSAVAFQFARNALSELQEKRSEPAALILRRYAKLQTSSLKECSKSVQCKGLVGKLMPSEAELKEVSEWDWNH
jgi:hypothetical protein